MSDSLITSTKSAMTYSATSKVSEPNKTLGKDEFLKILITQMKNQDPTQPLQDKEFIAQMAQFTSVEQLTNMGSEMKLLRQSLGFASGLIGKNVTWTEDGAVKSGLVDSIVVKNGGQFAKVGTQEISMDQVSQISNPVSGS
ncbi:MULTISPECIES: flagellar hook assembly protein FlgD [Paenibacillus]|uniref:flagellar hook assembly protein FlgD n=1 Tax=Paenibacillus TaxID=44249 RepID=UPI0022B902B4|nr:flagellar hook assembly protein FlgD [Paenibacillus caseinilyticus]MCZ8520051.1 flagellar hook assembly protein FlgD [Paenibacillus caseinilyticus]